MRHALGQKITLGSLLKFTLPSIVMMVIMSLYTVVDGVFVSRLIGTDAFSAVNIAYPLLSVAIALGTMFGTGTTAIISKKLGEGRRQEANENLTFVLVFTAILGVFLAVAGIVLLRPTLFLLGANEAVYGYCKEYACLLLLFVPMQLLQLQFQSFFVADASPGKGLFVTVLGGCANIVLDYVFIRWLGMGIGGAAIATGIGYSIPAVYGLVYFARGRTGNFRLVRPKADWRMLWRAVTNGSSEMVTNLSASITTLLFNLIMMHFIGPDGVAAISILLYLDFVLIAISLGYSMGVAPLFGYHYGAQDAQKLKKLYKLSLWLCTGVGCVMTVGTMLFSHPLTAVFTPKGTAVYELAAAGLRIYAAGYVFKGYNVFASAMFTAFGDGKVSALLSFLRTLVFLVISLVALAALFGVDGVWYASPLAETLAVGLAAFCTVRYRKKYGYL